MKDAQKKAESENKTVDLESYAEAAKRLNVLKTYKIYIDGKFPRTESGRFYELRSKEGELLANVCLCSRKDFKAAVVAARNVQEKWAAASAYNRGQILYRIAEMLEGRREQFIAELTEQGGSRKDAQHEVHAAIDRLVYYAGWSDKYCQVFSAVNPVSSSHFNFSLPEASGVVGIIAPEQSPLLGLVSVIAPTIVAGNTAIVLASNSKPLSAVTFSEVLHSSDVPAGVVNILTGTRKELLGQFASHMDVNAVLYCGNEQSEIAEIQTKAALNVKRVAIDRNEDWFSDEAQSPYHIMRHTEIKTTWHPIGI